MAIDEEMTREAILPCRDPFLFPDWIASHDAKTSVGAVAFGRERDFFRRHFPDIPVVLGGITLFAEADIFCAAGKDETK